MNSSLPEVSRLETAVRRLEAQVWICWIVCAGCTTLTAAVLLAAPAGARQAREGVSTVTAPCTVVDESGHALARIRERKGHAVLEVCRRDGKPVLELSEERGNGSLELRNQRNAPILECGADALQNGGYFRLRSSAGKESLIAMNGQGGPLINLRNPAGRNICVVGSDLDGAGLVLVRMADNREAVAIGAKASGGAIVVRNGGIVPKAMARISVDETGGRLQLYDASGTEKSPDP